MSTLTDDRAVKPAADPYWSRQLDAWEMGPRADPTVWHSPQYESGPHRLTREDLVSYERDGFYHDAGLLAETEARQLLAEADRLAEAATGREPGVIIEPGSKAVRSLFRLHQTNPLFRQLAQDPRLVEKARQILGSDVYVHQSRVNFKPAFDGKEFFWHSDFETWHIEDGMPRMRALSVSISLTGNNEFNGPLMVIPGSQENYVRCAGGTPENHFEQSLKKQEYGVPSREAMKQLVDAGGIVAPKGPPGSTLFFDCNLMHGSAGNLSPEPRTNFFIVYNSVENALVEPFGGHRPRPEFLGERVVVPIDDLKIDG